MTTTTCNIVDFEGQLALNLGGSKRRNEPIIEEQLIILCGTKAIDYDYLLGERMVSITGNYITIYNNDGRFIPVDCKTEIKIIETEIKKPRKGKGYDWKYELGKWWKVYQ